MLRRLAARCRSGRTARKAQEFGADLEAEPPYHLAVARPYFALVAREQEDELVRNFDAFDVQPGAAIGYVGDQTFTRQRAVGELDLGHPVDEVARRMPPFFGLERRHGNSLKADQGGP